MKRYSVLVVVLGFFFFTGLVHSQTQKNGWIKNLALYGTFINFSDSSLKNEGRSATLYGNISDNKHHLIEGIFAQTYIDYEAPYNNLNQSDFAIAYTNTNQLLKNISLRIGFHYINSDDQWTDEGKIVFGKLTYFVPYKWNAGIEADYSIYDKTSLDVNVFQLVSHFGIFIYGLVPKGSLYTESKLYYIHKDETVGDLSRDNFLSFEQSIFYTLWPWDIRLSGWGGKQIYAVKNGGFLVYNLADKYKAGITFEVGYTFLKSHIRLSLNVSNEWLKHVGFNDNVKQTCITIGLGKSFY